MINVNKADRMIESLEIIASDNYYPIEDDTNYQSLCEMVETAEFNGQDYINKLDFLELYKKVKDSIENY
jgi:hypothetical protein